MLYLFYQLFKYNMNRFMLAKCASINGIIDNVQNYQTKCCETVKQINA